MFQIPFKTNILSCFMKHNYNCIDINQSSILLLIREQFQLKSGCRGINLSSRIPNRFIIRKHVTSSRHAAEATMATPVTFRSSAINSKIIKNKNPQLPSNIALHYCPSILEGNIKISGFQPNYIYQLNGENIAETSKRPLLLLFAWMLAKEKHIKKYRHFWFHRGFDVLSIQTSPLAVLLPSIGGRQNAIEIFNFISNHQPFYDEILVHAFSVGGYQLCEFLNVLEQKLLHSDPITEQIYSSLKGFIIDSCVYPEDAPSGLSRAITKHKIMQPILEKSIDVFLKLTKSFTMDRYKQVSSTLFTNKKQVPGLMFYSKDDPVSNVMFNRKMHEGWKINGTLSDFLCWDQSTHVLHYKVHQDEYQNKVDEFVSKLSITKSKKIKSLCT